MAIGAPTNYVTRRAVWLWAAAEQPGVAHNNPFNISGGGKGQTACYAQCSGGSPIYGFDTMDDGITATANFMRNGYQSIISAFKGSNNAAISPGYTGSGPSEVIIWQAINESWWRGKAAAGTGCYPCSLHDDTLGQTTATTGLGSLIPGAGAQQPGTAGTGLGTNPPGNACFWQGPLGWCILTRSQFKAFVSALEIAAGGLVMGLGVLTLLAYGFDRSGAARIVTKTPVGRVAKTSLARRTTARRAAATETSRQSRLLETEQRQTRSREHAASLRTEATRERAALRRREIQERGRVTRAGERTRTREQVTRREHAAGIYAYRNLPRSSRGQVRSGDEPF